MTDPTPTPESLARWVTVRLAEAIAALGPARDDYLVLRDAESEIASEIAEAFEILERHADATLREKLERATARAENAECEFARLWDIVEGKVPNLRAIYGAADLSRRDILARALGAAADRIDSRGTTNGEAPQ